MIIDKSMAPIMTIQQQRPMMRILKKATLFIESKSFCFGVSGFGVLGFGVSGFWVRGFGVSDMIKLQLKVSILENDLLTSSLQ